MFQQLTDMVKFWIVTVLTVTVFVRVKSEWTGSWPRRILVDTDVDTDDFFALLYILKLNRSEFDLKAITINSNAWSNAGHAINHLYDILYMMDRDDIPIGVGGEGGILDDGTILPNVGGYLPIIEQGTTTVGGCRYRQAIPKGCGGRLDADTNYGIRKAFLPQVLHFGVPITIVPIDATNTIPISSNFYKEFERRQMTYEAQYCFQSLKIIRDTWFDDQFFTSYFMWDSFTSGIAASIMRNPSGENGENEFAQMEFMNITVVTSNLPYGASDGSNPFFDGRPIPKFYLDRDGVHSGHVQTGLRDPFCFSENGKGKCKDGYTEEIAGLDTVRVLVAKKAKPSTGVLDLAFYNNFLDTLNRPEHSGKRRFIPSTFGIPYDRKVSYNSRNMRKGRPFIFDTDMSAGDFLSLFLLLKVPVEIIDLKAILVTATGWANPATVDVIYDVLHMMGRDDIPVGLGGVYAMDQKDLVYSGVGGCKYVEAVPQGAGGFLDSDTLYGLARSLPRSPRRYTAENSVEHGAPRNTGHPEIRQALAEEVWESIIRELPSGSKISLLTGGPLTTLATILSSNKNHTLSIQDVFILGGHIPKDNTDQGNVYTVTSNRFAEFNMFLDPLAAKSVFESGTRITLVPLGVQRTVSSFKDVVRRLGGEPKTPEAVFSRRLLSILNRLRRTHPRYNHLGMFMGELLGATFVACEEALYPNLEYQKLRVVASGFEFADGEMVVDRKEGNEVRVVKLVNVSAHYDLISSLLRQPSISPNYKLFEFPL